MLSLLLATLVTAAPLSLLAGDVVGPPADAEDLAGLSDVLRSAITSVGFYEVLTSKDLAARVGMERQKELLGCGGESESCLTELAGAMNSDRILRAEVSKVDGIAQVIVSLVVGQNAKLTVLGRALRRASDVASLADEMRSAVYEVVNQDPARAQEKKLVAEKGFGGFMVGVRGDFDAVGLGAAPAVVLQYSGRRFGVVLAGIVKTSPAARLEGRWFPVTLGRVRPYVLAGGSASRTGVGLRAGAGLELHYWHFNAWLDAAYERYFIAPADYLVDAATIGLGVGWTF